MAGTLNNAVPALDLGYRQVQYLMKKIAYTDTGAVTIGTIPANSLINKAASGVHITTVFNAATTNVIDVGTTADDDLYGTDLAAGTTTFVPLDESVGGYFVTSDTTITATYAQTGTAATTGEGYVVIAFTKL